MRLLAFPFLLLLCNLYGLAFDLVVVTRMDGIVCELLGTQPCLLSQPADYWLSATGLLLALPAACVLLMHWLSDELRLLKSSAFLGLLLATP